MHLDDLSLGDLLLGRFYRSYSQHAILLLPSIVVTDDVTAPITCQLRGDLYRRVDAIGQSFDANLACVDR